MKKINFLAVVMLFSLTPFLLAQNFKGKAEQVKIANTQGKLTPGETLVYSVEWLGIPGGKIILKVEGKTVIDGRECYHVSARALPNAFFRMFHDVEYKVDSYIDIKTHFTRRFEKVRRLKQTFTYVAIEFNQEKNEATYKYYKPRGCVRITDFASLRKGISASDTKTVKVPAEVQDLLSGLYYLRLINLKEGTSYSVNISYEQKKWPLKIKEGKPFLKDIYRKGTFSVLELSPQSDLIDFISGKRRISVYFTADSLRTPVLFTINTNIGLLRGVIQDLPR
jgi:hypothetical protein